jgi:hypothetical protein
MEKPMTTMTIVKLLEKSNCRECLEPTCLAFAAAVFQGRKNLAECPRLDPAIVDRFSTRAEPSKENDTEAALSGLKEAVAKLDLSAAARRIGADFTAGRLTLKILGKDFSLDARGNLYSDIHIHPWVAVPFLHHVLVGRGSAPTRRWVPLRELPNGKTWYRLFGQRCEDPLRRIADRYPELFEELIRLFNGRMADSPTAADADIALVLYPLPLLPMVIRYWKPESGFDSTLNLFFDAQAEENLPIESIFALAAGLVRMFEKIVVRHGITGTQRDCE